MERVEFFEEYVIFEKNSAKLCGTDAFENLVRSAPVRLGKSESSELSPTAIFPLFRFFHTVKSFSLLFCRFALYYK